MLRSFKGAVLASVGALAIAALLTPFLANWATPHPEQDECSFGPVTNAEYRRMLAEATALYKGRWFWQMSPGYNKALSDQYLAITANQVSPYIKIAAIHAVMRAWGAEFRNVGDDAFSLIAKAGGGSISFNYSLAVPRFGLVALPGDTWFIGSLNGPPTATMKSDANRFRQGHVDFVTWFPNPFDPIQDSALQRTKLLCPPVPPSELEPLFTG